MDAVVGLIGAVVGSLATLSGQLVASRSETQRHWSESRLQAYTQMYRAVLAIWEAFDDDGARLDEPGLLERKRAELRDAYAAATLMVRTIATDQALDGVFNAASYAWARRGRTWEQVDRGIFDQQAAFVLAARKELGQPPVTMISYEQHKHGL